MSTGLLERASEFRAKAAEYLQRAETLEKMDAEVISAMAEPGNVPVTQTQTSSKKVSTPTTATNGSGKRRGRPAGSKNKEDSGKMGVKTLVLDILRQNRGGMSLADLTKACLSSGYKTKSKNFSNVLYQNLQALKREEKKVILNKEDKLWKLAG